MTATVNQIKRAPNCRQKWII